MCSENEVGKGDLVGSHPVCNIIATLIDILRHVGRPVVLFYVLFISAPNDGSKNVTKRGVDVVLSFVFDF